MDYHLTVRARLKLTSCARLANRPQLAHAAFVGSLNEVRAASGQPFVPGGDV